MKEIVVIAHNIRSAHNIGSIFRTCDGFGVSKIILTGYSPYPICENDPRLPHIASKIDKDIHKTALGAEKMVAFCHMPVFDLSSLKADGFSLVGLEQSPRSVKLPNYKAPQKIALVLGEEVNGIDSAILKKCDDVIEIPMLGKKESFNVAVAAGIALYALTIA